MSQYPCCVHNFVYMYLRREEFCLRGLQVHSLGEVTRNLPSSAGDLFVPTAFTICLQWLLVQVFLDRVLPGKVKRVDNSQYRRSQCIHKVLT